MKKNKGKKYGLSSIVENKLYFENGELLYKDNQDRIRNGYDCLTSSISLKNKLNGQNMESDVIVGKDEFGIFERHCFVKTKNNTIIDPSGLYSVIGANHVSIKKLSKREIEKEEKTHYHVIENLEELPIRTYGKGKSLKVSFISLKYPKNINLSSFIRYKSKRQDINDFTFFYTLKSNKKKEKLMIYINNSKKLNGDTSILNKSFEYLINKNILFIDNLARYKKIKNEIKKDELIIKDFIKRVYEAIL